MSRLFADENFPLPVVQVLRSLGHEVLTIHEIGKSGYGVSNEAVLDNAINERRTVLTLNRKHFIQLHHRRPEHAGIVVCTSDSNFNAQGQRIHAAIAAESDLSGKLIRVNRPGPGDLQPPTAEKAPLF